MAPRDKFSIEPLYVQVRNLLAQRLASGVWPPGSALPNEMELARELGVSSGTVRKALDSLESDRLVVRRQGRGTFVVDQASGDVAARFSNIRNGEGRRIGGDMELLTQVKAVATEIVCILRYRCHAITARGIASESVKKEFAQHAVEEEQHLLWIAERINQLGGKPDLNPDGVGERAASQYVEGTNLVDMIKENLVAERIAVETYRDMIRYFAEKDPTTRVLLERVLAQEEEHANDMHDLLVAHEGRPMLPG